MNILESVKSSISNVLSNKMRSLLTMLGIIIGVASVIVISSIGEGSTQQINEQFDSMGTGNLTVSLSGGGEIRDADQMTLADVDLIMAMDGVKYASPIYSGESQEIKLQNPKQTRRASLTGVNDCLINRKNGWNQSMSTVFKGALNGLMPTNAAYWNSVMRNPISDALGAGSSSAAPDALSFACSVADNCAKSTPSRLSSLPADYYYFNETYAPDRIKIGDFYLRKTY